MYILGTLLSPLTLPSRWLIDTDKDVEGMRVIADLHGGNLDNPVAVAEFQDIKGKVHEEVSMTYLPVIRAQFGEAGIWRRSILSNDVEKV